MSVDLPKSRGAMAPPGTTPLQFKEYLTSDLAEWYHVCVYVTWSHLKNWIQANGHGTQGAKIVEKVHKPSLKTLGDVQVKKEDHV